MQTHPVRCLVAIGDSITVGYQASRPEYAWVNRLGTLLGEFQERPPRVINAGISGNLLSPRSPAYLHPDSGRPSGLERCGRDVTAHRPDLVAVAFGLNDMRGGTPVDVFLEDLDLLVRKIRGGTSASLVLLGVYFMVGYDRHGEVWGHGNTETTGQWNDRLRLLADAHDLVFADVYAAQEDASWTVAPDGVHPNDLGHALIAHKVFEALAVGRPDWGATARPNTAAAGGWAEALEQPLRTYDGVGASG